MKVLIQAAVVTLFAASTVQAQQAVQWKVSDGGNGHWYQLAVQPNMNWQQCLDMARQRGGDLVSIASGAEQAFVYAIAAQVPEAFVGPYGPFIGAFQDRTAPDFSEPAGGWRWSDGSPWAFAGFYKGGEPNNCMASCSGVCADEDVAQLYGPQYGGWWNDLPAIPVLGCQVEWIAMAHLVEWSADCNNDGIVDYGQCRDGSLPDYNGNNIPDCCEAGTPCVVGNYPVQWRVADGGNGHWYADSTPSMTWIPLAEWCTARGGHLASLTAETEFSWVRSRFPVIGRFVGGYQDTSATDYSEPSGAWRWVTNEPFFAIPSFMAQFDDCPGGSPGWCGCGTPGAQNVLFFTGCCGVVLDDVGDGVVQNCDSVARRGIIEWSADCNNDGIVDKGQILLGQLADVNGNGVPDACEAPTCQDADIVEDAQVNGADLGLLLSQWGDASATTSGDLNHDGSVNGADLSILLSFWGPCP